MWVRDRVTWLDPPLPHPTPDGTRIGGRMYPTPLPPGRTIFTEIHRFVYNRYTGVYSMDAIASTAFGLHLKDKNNEFIQMANKCLNNSLLNPWVFMYSKFFQKNA